MSLVTCVQCPVLSPPTHAPACQKASSRPSHFAEHENEITIRKAAKSYFDGLGFKKLPTIKALNAEYAELLAAKANIDRILELDKEQAEANERREKEAEQR